MAISSILEEPVGEQAAAVLAKAQESLQMPGPPNFFRMLAASPEALTGVWGMVDAVLLQGVLPRGLKEAIISAISGSRGCDYCAAAHGIFAHMLGTDPAAYEKLGGKERAIAMLAVSCARAPQGDHEPLYKACRDEGANEREITEAVSLAALANMLNTLADATRVELDEPMKGVLR